MTREETLGWDASADHDASVFPTFRDSGSMSRKTTTDSDTVIEPTQRVSQIMGLW
jgi:cell cycle checkpoint control protein RAD9A